MRKLFTVLALSAMAASLFSSCKSNSAASSGSDSTAAVMKKNIQTALAADSAITKHDIDGYFKLCATAYTELGTQNDKPEKNVDSIKNEMKTFFGAYPDFKAEDLKAYGSSDGGVLVTGTFSATFTKPYLKMPPTNKGFKVFDGDIYTFDKDGKITSHRAIVPESIYMSQAGVVFPDKDKDKK